ncbi:hypothetical protein [Methylobacter svalbardensis]|uniref:hypothetical protein n=1 Tax=Methylobacter svalbardensis TaxID=3080016 RepID=UPI0030EBACCB
MVGEEIGMFFTALDIHRDMWFFVRRNTKLDIVDDVLFKGSKSAETICQKEISTP